MTHTNIALYHRPMCPYCRKVRNFMADNGIDIPLKDVSVKETSNELIQIGGKGQVPCLVRDGVALYESDDIIRWLKDHLGELSRES